jgi:hypothetical protein
MLHRCEWSLFNLTGNTFASILKVYGYEVETHIFLVHSSGVLLEQALKI